MPRRETKLPEPTTMTTSGCPCWFLRPSRNAWGETSSSSLKRVKIAPRVSPPALSSDRADRTFFFSKPSPRPRPGVDLSAPVAPDPYQWAAASRKPRSLVCVCTVCVEVSAPLDVLGLFLILVDSSCNFGELPYARDNPAYGAHLHRPGLAIEEWMVGLESGPEANAVDQNRER